MSTLSKNESFKLPESLRIQLDALRTQLHRVKIGQAVALSLACTFAAAITLFIVDRFYDTTTSTRFALFALAMSSIIAVPVAIIKWYWTTRTSYQVSVWLRQRNKSIGDRLMGAIELSQSQAEQSRSPGLVVAAMNQVATVTAKTDLNAFIPRQGYRRAILLAASISICLGFIALLFPTGIANAMLRLSLPWRAIPRYTFTSIEPLPSQLAVPFGESFSIDAKLSAQSTWVPKTGEVLITDRNRPGISSSISSAPIHGSKPDSYRFEFPGETVLKQLDLKIGDFRHRIDIVPVHRPEVNAIEAHIILPNYLQQKSNERTLDARRGSLEVLQGSTIRFHATANQPIASANIKQIDAPETVPIQISGNNMLSAPIFANESPRTFVWTWQDENGFSGKKPLTIQYLPLLDSPPQSNLGGIGFEQVVINSEQVNFSIESFDDFGVKTLGIEWSAYTGDAIDKANPIYKGSSILKTGGPEELSIKAIGSISPIEIVKDSKFESGMIELRGWSQDYFPDRERTYSPPVKLLVLTPEQHSQWITSQLDQWQRLGLDVRDRELQNFDKNKALHQSTTTGESKSGLGRKLATDLESQSKEEATNASRLEALAASGEKLLSIAVKNESIAVGHLEKWAEIQDAIKRLSQNKMPEVASLLQKASQQVAKKDFALNTAESSQQPDDQSVNQTVEPAPEEKSNPSDTLSKLSLPQTTLTGPTTKTPSDTQQVARDTQPSTTAEAIAAQEKVLEEFNKLSEEMNSILGNLESSTFVKRLKAASRAQGQIATSIRQSLAIQYSSQYPSSSEPRSADSRSASTPNFSDPQNQKTSESVEMSKASGMDLSNIVDDMEAFFQRRQTNGFRTVLDEIQSSKVVSAINQLANDIPLEQGMSVAQAEYWSDAIDRWAEELVDPAKSGSCPGSKNSDSLPPSVVLDALRLLEGQVNLREQTRVAEQRSNAISPLERTDETNRLASLQSSLDQKANDILARVTELPDASSKFENEIRMFEQVDAWMVDSANRLRKADTGREEMALQTEIIETLLKSKRINPKGGGGGSGGAPGGGGQGEAVDSALALLGNGTNFKEVRETREVEQSSGVSGSILPDEYRKGLDKYFEAIERSRSVEQGFR